MRRSNSPEHFILGWTSGLFTAIVARNAAARHRYVLPRADQRRRRRLGAANPQHREHPVIDWVDSCCKTWGRCTRWILTDTGEGYPTADSIERARQGLLSMGDGPRVVRFDGIRCSVLGLDHLELFVLGADTSLLIVPTGPTQDGILRRISGPWERSGDTVSYLFPAEMAISSGWCDAQHSITSPHNDRFQALEHTFADERREFVGNAR